MLSLAFTSLGFPLPRGQLTGNLAASVEIREGETIECTLQRRAGVCPSGQLLLDHPDIVNRAKFTLFELKTIFVVLSQGNSISNIMYL